MQIISLELYTRNLSAMQDFYASTLQLPLIEQDDRHFTVRAGHSMLTFTSTTDTVPICHYAFNVPEASFPASKQWLQDRVTLLKDDEQQDEVYFRNWDAHASYFSDPDGNIGEIIARHTLPDAVAHEPSAHPVLGISEIGIAADDVLSLVNTVTTRTGMQPYKQTPSPDFTAVGSEKGLLIINRTERTWLPENRDIVQPVPLRVRFEVQSSAQPLAFEITGPPYGLAAVMT